LIPAQIGSADITGAEGVIILPQLSVTDGGVGITASAAQVMVDEPLAGIVTIGAAMLYT
jgi:hypothetical protein